MMKFRSRWLRRNRQRSSFAQPPSNIDFSTIPVYEVAEKLRWLGEALVSNVLSTGSGLSLPSLLDQGHISQHLAVPANSTFDHYAPRSSYKRLLRGQANKVVDETEFRMSLLHQYETALGGYDKTYIPDEYWPLIGSLAWNDLSFNVAVSKALVDYFYTRKLFIGSDETGGEWMRGIGYQTDIPTPLLSPETFWWLVLLKDSKNSIRSKPATRMLTIAEKAVALNGWAHFWDLWLLKKASAGNTIVTHLPDALKRAIHEINVDLGQNSLKGRRRSSIQLQSGSTQTEMEQKESSGTASSKGKGKQIKEELHLAAIRWRSQRPDWYSEQSSTF